MDTVETLSKSKEKKIKKYLELYSLALGIGSARGNLTYRQMLIRICSKRPKIGAYVRPAYGKVNGEQSARMLRYMIENPLDGVVIPDNLLSNQPQPPRHMVDKHTKKIANRIRVAAKEVAVAERDLFYKSWEWKRLRYDVLQQFGPVCMCCAARRGDVTNDGSPVRIVVDHVKPIAKFWHLRLQRSNLQVLCDDCNMGKGSRDETDFRPAPPAPAEEPYEEELPEGVDPAILAQLHYSIN